MAILRSTILFDPVWYRESHPDLRGTAIDSIAHYLEHGASEGRNPHPLFDTIWYLRHTPEASEVAALVHYLSRKEFKGSRPHPLFDVDYYVSQSLDFSGTGLDPLTHYLTVGWKRGARPNQFFEPEWYLEQYPDVRRLGMEPLLHFMEFGWREGRQASRSIDLVAYRQRHQLSDDENPLLHFARSNEKTILQHASSEAPVRVIPEISKPPKSSRHWVRRLSPGERFRINADIRIIRNSRLFDERYYRATYPDLPSGIDLVRHFVEVGAKEARNPNRLFDIAFYLSENPDVAKSGINPLVHFIQRGFVEGRFPSPEFDPLFYLSVHKDVARAQMNPLAHYLLYGEKEGRKINASETTSVATNKKNTAPNVSSTPIDNSHYDTLKTIKGNFKGTRSDSRAGNAVAATTHVVREDLLVDRVKGRETTGAAVSRALTAIIQFKSGAPLNTTAIRQAGKEDIETVRNSGLFDDEFYLASNPDLPKGLDPVKHFLKLGAWEGRKPNRMFDPTFYLQSNPDVDKSGMNPLVHFVQYGCSEGRRPHPHFDPIFYLAENSDVASTNMNPLLHYLLHGAREGRRPADLSYDQWCAVYDTLTDDDRRKIVERISKLRYKPIFSVVLPISDLSPSSAGAIIQSIQKQIYPCWELLIVADRQSSVELLSERFLESIKSDERIKLAGSHAADLNASLNAAVGEFVAIMPDCAELSEIALYMFAEKLNECSTANILYSDEDRIDRNNQRAEPHFKSDWNPDLFYSVSYIGQLAFLRMELVRKVGGLRVTFRGAEAYDLLLRMIEHSGPDAICHIPFVLYHERANATFVAQANAALQLRPNAERHSLSQHFYRSGHSKVRVVAGVRDEFHRVIWPITNPAPLVSLVIPTGGNLGLLPNCVSGILERTKYDNLEVIILYNSGTREEIFPYLEEISADPRVSIVNSRSSFNFSRICNIGVDHARGEIIGLINDDVDVINPDWLEEMVGQVVRPEVGAVGAMLYYENDTIQHAGLTLGVNGLTEHRYRHFPRGTLGYFGRAAVTQDLSGVTAACLVVRKKVYLEVGGFEEEIAVCFNDVDFCLKIRERGYRIVWTPYAELYHRERMSAPKDDAPGEEIRFKTESDYVKRKWEAVLSRNDPYFNPNLRLDNPGYEIGAAPRVIKPWLVE